jgi:anti-anti-sigma factor
VVTVSNGTWSCEVHDGALVVELSGEIDCSNAPQIYERVKLEVEDVPSDRLVVDLGAVTFLDSSGIRFIVQAQRTIEAVGGHLELRGVRPQAKKVLEVTGVLQRLG